MTIINKAKNLIDFGRTSRAGLIVLLEIAAGIALALASLGAFAGIADEVIEKETSSFDAAVQAAAYSLRSPAMTDAMFVMSFLGSKEFLFAVSISLIVVFCVKGKRRTAFTYSVILLLSAGLNNLIKLMIHRDRPEFLPLEKTFFYSFPSGHSMNSLVFYGLLAYFIYHYTRNKRLGAAAYLIAAASVFLIGFSRIYLGAHYPTDVIAGFIAGICVLSTAITIDKTLELNNFLKKSNRI
jgi:undecaprenyl-diphosphatase